MHQYFQNYKQQEGLDEAETFEDSDHFDEACLIKQVNWT